MERDNMKQADESRPGSADAWLKQSLEPPRATVNRVVRRSLVAESPSFVGRGWRAASVAAIFITLVAAVVLLTWRGGREQRPLSAVPTITNKNGRVELVLPAGTQGTSRDVALIFNESRVVAAVVPDANPVFLISGGES